MPIITRSSRDESLQDFAKRTRRTIVAAYADWHNANSASARVIANPFTAPNGYEHVTCSGRCLGLLPDDVRAVSNGVY